jgi:hypothetical protein
MSTNMEILASQAERDSIKYMQIIHERPWRRAVA